MTHDEYVAAVLRGEYPDNPRVPLPSEVFINKAGTIQNLVFGNFGGAAVIFSRLGTTRSDHYHKTDWHFLYVLEGQMEYFWGDVGSTLPSQKLVVERGGMIFTPPLIEHTTTFPVDTTLLSFSRNRRDHVSHEADVVRVESLWRP